MTLHGEHEKARQALLAAEQALLRVKRDADAGAFDAPFQWAATHRPLLVERLSRLSPSNHSSLEIVAVAHRVIILDWLIHDAPGADTKMLSKKGRRLARQALRKAEAELRKVDKASP